MLGISNPIGKKDRKGAWGDGHLSFELDEIMNLSDKIAVIHNGQLTGFIKRNETDEKEIGLMMTGSIKRVEELYEKN